MELSTTYENRFEITHIMMRIAILRLNADLAAIAAGSVAVMELSQDSRKDSFQTIGLIFV